MISETLPLTAYGLGTGLLTITGNNGLEIMHKANDVMPIATMAICPWMMAVGGAAVVGSHILLKERAAAFRWTPVLSGLVLGVSFGAAVAAKTEDLDTYIDRALEGRMAQLAPSLP